MIDRNVFKIDNVMEMKCAFLIRTRIRSHRRDVAVDHVNAICVNERRNANENVNGWSGRRSESENAKDSGNKGKLELG